MKLNSIALLIPNCNPGGTERVAQRFSCYLQKKGYSVLVLSMANKPFPYPLECSYETLDQATLHKGKIARFRARLKRLKQLLAAYQTTAILSMGEYPNFLVACLPKKYTRINRYTNSSIALKGISGFLIQQALRFAYVRTDKTIVPVLRLANELGFSMTSSKLIEMPNPLDLEEMKQLSLKEKTPIPYALNEPFFLHVGQLVEQKDHAFLLRAYALYRKQGGTHRLFMLGQGEKKIEIEEIIQQHALTSYAILVGWVENPLSFMKKACALLMTSKWEGTPNVMIEAMSLGCPIISTDCPTGPHEILNKGQAGRLVPVGDLNAFVEEMHHMAQDSKWHMQWCQRAQQRANNYSIEHIGPQLTQLLQPQSNTYD